jgi:hypothetical protein
MHSARPAGNEYVDPVCLNERLFTETEVLLLGFKEEVSGYFLDTSNTNIPFAGLPFIFAVAKVLHFIRAFYRNGKEYSYQILVLLLPEVQILFSVIHWFSNILLVLLSLTT